MLKIHVLSSSRARRTASKGFALAAIIVTAIIVLGAALLGSPGDYSVEALTNASAKFIRDFPPHSITVLKFKAR